MATETLLEVSHYGCVDLGHGVRVLCQDGGATHPHLTMKWGVTVTPFKARAKCPHRFNLDDYDESADPTNFSEAARLFLPIPPAESQKIAFIRGRPSLTWLLRLGSPVRPTVFPAWNLPLKQIAFELSITNLVPLVLYDFRPTSGRDIRDLMGMADFGVRRLICVGNEDIILPSYLECHQWQDQPPPPPELDPTKIGTKILRDYLTHDPETISDERPRSVHQEQTIY